ncbi:MAG: Rrf2 family transcriptional regulator [Planctomycetota bacterium]|nr:Rrf2 family transcriptional regulator [Planctomycetota bacterium]
MMQASQKCQYALRAVLELAKRLGEGPATASDIADAQAIPPKFLELILQELRQAGLVESRRGPQGGYLLAGDPRALTVGQVIRLIEGPFAPVSCIAAGDPGAPEPCPLQGRCAFLNMWERAHSAVAGVLDATTFQDLIEAEREVAFVPNYCI